MQPDLVIKLVIENLMSLDPERVVFSVEEYKPEKDLGIFFIISTGTIKTIGNNVKYEEDPTDEDKSIEVSCISLFTTYNLDMISQDRSSIERFPELASVLRSQAMTQEMEKNGMGIQTILEAQDLSAVEGARSLHRLRIPVIISHSKTIKRVVDPILTIREPEVRTEE